MAHEITSPKTSLNFPNNDEEALVMQPKQALRLAQNAFNKLLRN